MFGNKQGKVRVLGFKRFVLITVAVHGDDAVRVFHDNGTAGIHAEGTDEILILLGVVDDFAFINLIGNVSENICQKFNAHTDVDAVGKRGNIE